MCFYEVRGDLATTSFMQEICELENPICVKVRGCHVCTGVN